MHIDYRQLLAYECERISEIDASTFVKRAWRKVDSGKQWVGINWQDDDFPGGYDNHLAALKEIFIKGGFAIGAFDGERLIGFCSVSLDVFGKQHKYALLDQIFISKKYKRKGIGRKLFYMSADKARKHGADKFYICAGSSEDTLAFYASLGCKDAEEINQELYESDPNDVQLEYDLSNTQNCAEIKTERLFLRTLTDADAETLKHFSDEFENIESALEWIRWVNTRKDKNDICFMFYIWLKQTSQLIGRVYFHSKYELGGEVEIGYGINEEHRNKGYATEAAKAVVKFAFEQAEQGELAAIVKRENIASRCVIEKLGFVYHGVRTVFDEGKDCEFDYFKLFPSIS